jgi:D-alanyl-D-alanine carboxypeptidase
VRYPAHKTDETGVSDYAYCFRYVGIPHATYISEKNICLEEYVELLKTNHSGSEHLKIEGADGKSYEVYYVAAGSGDLTTLSVPSNYAYTISGDNMGGFIVTVDLSTPKA